MNQESTTLSKEFKKLVAWGYGRSEPHEMDPVFGKSTWLFRDEEIDLKVFERGLTYSDGNEPVEIVFSMVTVITSTLTVKQLSHASGTFTGRERLPLIIQATKEHDLSIPLSIYSNILNGLFELCPGARP